MKIEIIKPGKWFNFTQPSSVEEVPEIVIYDFIGSANPENEEGGMSGKAFCDGLKNLERMGYKKANLRLNSQGGFIHDGFAMYNAIKQSPIEINAYIDALAASTASWVAMACNKVYMAANSEMMIHDPWSYVVGKSEDMRSEADHLDSLKTMIINTYAEKTGLEPKKIAKMMAATTWMDGAKAVELGFADGVVNSSKTVASNFARLPLSAIPGVPDDVVKRQAAIEKRRQENALRDAGLSRHEAKEAISRSEREAGVEIQIDQEQVQRQANQLIINEVRKCLK